jgi:hypothetical protein
MFILDLFVDITTEKRLYYQIITLNIHLIKTIGQNLTINTLDVLILSEKKLLKYIRREDLFKSFQNKSINHIDD